MSAVLEKKTEEVKRKIPTIMPGDDFGLAEFKQRHHIADVHQDVLESDVLEPGYWAHVADQMKTLDIISCRWQDSSKVVHLRVIRSGARFCNVVRIGFEDLSKGSIERPAGTINLIAKYKGTVRKWAAVRLSDDHVLHDGMETRAEAEVWIEQHEKA